MHTPKIRYEIVRSKRRRTAAIKVEPGQVRVLVPHWVDDTWINDWVLQKQAWIQSKQQQICDQSERFMVHVVQGGLIPFRSKQLTLQWQPGDRSAVYRDGEQLLIILSRRGRRADELRATELLKSWYQQEAELYLQVRLTYWQGIIGLHATGLTVKGFKRRWGSCDNRGGIALNWRLILTPESLIDYVIVHELAHLKHFNHSTRFWSLVHTYLPDYEALRADLQTRNILLRF